MSLQDELDRAMEQGKGPGSRRKAWLWLLIAVVPVGGYFLLFGDAAVDRDDQPPPLVATVQYRVIGDVVAASGQLKPAKVVEVGALVSGQLDKLHVRAGDSVSKGDVLAEIDATIQTNVVEAERAKLQTLRARLAPARSSIELAEEAVAREERLMREQATYQYALDRSRNALLNVRSTLIELESTIESQEAVIASEEAKLRYSTIYAPVSGIVVAVNTTEGQTLNATQTAPVILSIANLSSMVVEAQVAEANVGKLSPGAGVSFTTLGGGARRWRGELERIIPKAANVNNVISYTAVFEVENPDGALLPDMTAQVFFELSEPRRVLSVPVDMLANFGGAVPGVGRDAKVRLLRDDGGIELREVIVGEIGSGYAEVLEGLGEGDKVVAPESERSQ